MAVIDNNELGGDGKVVLRNSDTRNSTTTTDESKNTTDTSSATVRSRELNSDIGADFEEFQENPVLQKIREGGYANAYRQTMPNPMDSPLYDPDKLERIKKDNRRRQNIQALHGVLSTLADTAIAFGGGNVYKRNYDYISDTDNAITKEEAKKEAYDLKQREQYREWLKGLNDAIVKDKQMEADLTKEFMKNMGYKDVSATTTKSDTTIGEKKSRTSSSSSGSRETQDRGGSGSGSGSKGFNSLSLNTYETTDNITGTKYLGQQQWSLQPGKNSTALAQSVINTYPYLNNKEKEFIVNRMKGLMDDDNFDINSLNNLIDLFKNYNNDDGKKIDDTTMRQFQTFMSVALGNVPYGEVQDGVQKYYSIPRMKQIRDNYLKPDPIGPTYENDNSDINIVNDIKNNERESK